jgi:hypothetical protein
MGARNPKGLNLAKMGQWSPTLEGGELYCSYSKSIVVVFSLYMK